MKHLLIIFVLLFSQSISAISQKTFINQLLERHDFFEEAMINLKIKHIEMIGDRDNYANWDWDISAEIGNIYKDKFKYDYTSSTDYAQKTTQKVRKISSDLSKRFFNNGSELSLSFDRSLPIKHEVLYDKHGYQKDKESVEYLNDLGVSWTLPLLKNKNGVVDQKTYDLAALDYADEILVLSEVQEDFIEDKVFEFIDWVGYQWQIDIVSKSIKNLAKIRHKAIKHSPRDADVLTRSIDKYARLLLSVESKLQAQNMLLLASVGTLDFANNAPKLERDFKINLIDNLENYKTQVRDLMRIDIEISKNNRYIKTYENSKLANLDLTLSATKENNQGNYTSYSKSSELEYESSLVFSYPLTGDISNQVYLDKYLLKTKQLQLKYNNKLKYVIVNARKIETDIKQGLVQLSLIKQQLESFEPERESKLYFKNMGEIGFVINEANEYQDIQLEEITTLIELYKNKLKYDSLLDRLLPPQKQEFVYQ